MLKPEAEDQLNILQQCIAVFKRPCTETLYYSVHVFPLTLFLCIVGKIYAFVNFYLEMIKYKFD